MIRLVLGGVRSGKSRYAELLLAAHPAVTYIAPGPEVDAAADADWAARVAAHQGARPPGWVTVETADVATAVRDAATGGAVLVDCLGTWVTRLVDDADAWDDRRAAQQAVRLGLHDLLAALGGAGSDCDIVLVSNEVGLGVVPAHRSGRLFRDELGRVNAAVADAADAVDLVVAGRVLSLGRSPRVEQAARLARNDAR